MTNATGGLIEFELWSRNTWPNLDVVGEYYHQDEIRQLFPQTIDFNDRELICTASLLPEPSNKVDPNAVKVVVQGRHVGYLAKEIAGSYAPTLAALLRQGLLPVTPCRIYGYEYQNYDIDQRGREIRKIVFDAQARIVLDEPHLIVPLNTPPDGPHRLLPRGSSLQVREEEKHLDVLTPLVAQHGEGWVFATLHSLRVASGRSEKVLIELHIDGEPIGVLTPAMSQHFLPAVDHLDATGEQTAARVFLKGNALKVEAVLHAAKAHELDGSWLGEAAGATTSQVVTTAGHAERDQPPVAVPASAPPMPAEPAVIPPRPTTIVFNPPPGWPEPLPGSEPAPGWQAPPDWPVPPADWQFWIAR